MSSEQRIKKLRGSGGYVMASVNDDQQRKGNLGGPDLFLAPIGRLDSAKITKYFCNTCEKNYEGSPKIDFENPNEEVAENLVLGERGQYLCATCGSTIAEYREFRKPDEQSDVGLAKPAEQDPDDPALAPSRLAADTSFMESPPVQELPPMPPQFDAPQATAEMQPAMEQSPTLVNSIVDMSVFDENGVKVGTAKQVGVDAAQNVVLVVAKSDGDDLVIPWNRIKKVGEIILLGGDQSDSGTQPQTQSTGACPSCGFENKAGSKFCEQCGSKV